MKEKKKWLWILVALAVCVGGGFAVRSLTAVTYAEGYLFAADDRLLHARVIPGKEEVAVELEEAKIESKDGLPAVIIEYHQYKGTVDGNSLLLQTKEGEKFAATVDQETLVFQQTWLEEYGPETRLLAVQAADYRQKMEELNRRARAEAEEIQKQIAEQKAQERAALDKQVKQFERLEADIREHIDYIADYQVAEEQAAYEQHLADLQALHQEITAMGPKAGLSATETALAESLASSMNMLMDGVHTLDDKVGKKAKALAGIIDTLQDDMEQAQALWEQLKETHLDVGKRGEAFAETLKAGTAALAEARKNAAAADKMLKTYRKQAEDTYKQATAGLAP
ncbi:hypothetical protein KDJ56_15020 [Brevibacillus composti]|uniref:Uncharacterized protein n=1 Tax=Brevibacillus composti TaxID=2796470 RepID=A0A7T5EIF4_9BACL|nr:hypothetical protein [Brevibacillus composti]QQE73221.1 hypothetical protein JD108_15075 [Brevibacillus composti]QUO40302.1 hypothetical protein KDJ56_15020 [Brevibacillus composti]